MYFAFSPGVHWLQDPRSRVYNFSTWLEKIPKVTDFAFERLAGFIRSSRDEVFGFLTTSIFSWLIRIVYCVGPLVASETRKSYICRVNLVSNGHAKSNIFLNIWR
jgi:hypothetical protein